MNPGAISQPLSMELLQSQARLVLAVTARHWAIGPLPPEWRCRSRRLQSVGAGNRNPARSVYPLGEGG